MNPLDCRPLRTATFLALLVAFSRPWHPLPAAEPELVGVLALALRADVADELELSDEQRQQLIDLVDRRELAGVDLALAAQNLSRDERLKKLAQFRAHSQKLGMQVLTREQQAKLRKIQAEQDDPAFAPVENEAEPSPPADSPPAPRPDSTTVIDPVADAHRATQPDVDAERPTTSTGADDDSLTFNFRYQPWQDVLDWLAERADLSLVLESPPPGTLNYTDSREYTLTEALDLLNGILLTKGYTLVRRQRMLFVVNLEDGVPPNLVTDVPLDELDERGRFELVRTVFPVRSMTADEAATEVEKLIGPQGAVVVLPRAGKIQVTETAGRLRTIRDVLRSIERPDDEGPQQFQLRYLRVSDALPIVRQMLGIPDEAFETPDGTLQIATDPSTSRLFVRGTPVLVDRLEELLALIDVPEAAGSGPTDLPQLEVYPISTADPVAVLEVMQTLLAGDPSVRLATDPQTGNLVALARPSQHATIRATIDQMQRDARTVDVIPLSSVDPQIAVLAINKLFAGTGEEPDPLAPRVDADPTTGSLLVRGTSGQIKQIRDVLEKMGETESAGDVRRTRGNVRLLPLSGPAVSSALAQIQEIWPTLRQNQIRVVTPSAGIQTYRPSEDDQPPAADQPPAGSPAGLDPELLRMWRLLEEAAEAEEPSASKSPARSPFRFVQQTTDEAENGEAAKDEPAKSRRGAPIIVAPGPGGLLITSEDLDALDDFEELLSIVAGKTSTTGRQYAVYYLKYAKAQTVAELLAAIFGGGAGGDGLIGDLAGAALGDMGGGLMGDLLGLGGGAGASFTSAAVDIVPDARLNSLIVHARPADLDTIEQLLKILDQRVGPEVVEADARPRLIPVYNTLATQVAEVVQQVYQDRLQAAGGPPQLSPDQLLRALRGGSGGPGDVEQETQKMSIGVDTRSNSLVVRAPDPLFEDVKFLVEQLDKETLESPDAMTVVSLRHSNSEAVHDALQSILGSSVVTQSQASAGGNGDARDRGARGQRDEGEGSDEEAARQMRRQIDFFRRLRELRGGRSGDDGGGRGGRGGRGSRGR